MNSEIETMKIHHNQNLIVLSTILQLKTSDAKVTVQKARSITQILISVNSSISVKLTLEDLLVAIF